MTGVQTCALPILGTRPGRCGSSTISWGQLPSVDVLRRSLKGRYLVCFVYLVDLVHLVSFVQPNKLNTPNKPNEPVPCGSLLLGRLFEYHSGIVAAKSKGVQQGHFHPTLLC